MTKVLIVGPAWVGDMVMSQCLFKLLKEREKDIHIEVLAPKWSLPLTAKMPEVSAGIPLPLQQGELQLMQRYRLGKSLRGMQYDQAIILPNSFKSALPAWFGHIPKRTGWCGELRFGLLNDMRFLDKKRYPLMIERFMALGLAPKKTIPKPYPLPELTVTPEDRIKVLKKFNLKLPTRPILALAPGAEFGIAKRWPATYFAEIALEKLRAGWEVFIFGSSKDESTAETIMHHTDKQCVNFTGKTTLAEAIDLLSYASALVSNDSGLMHIGAALKKPLIAIYGPTSAAFTPPPIAPSRNLKS